MSEPKRPKAPTTYVSRGILKRDPYNDRWVDYWLDKWFAAAYAAGYWAAQQDLRHGRKRRNPFSKEWLPIRNKENK